MLPGEFTVSSKGDKVQFSSGNLWYNTSTGVWDFEERQQDYQTSWDANHIDRFFWSKNASVAVAKEFFDPGRSKRDIFFAEDNFTVNGYSKWGTLSSSEWNYLLFTRSTNVTGVEGANARFARVIVDGVKGLLLFPDTFTWDASTMGNSPALVNSKATISDTWAEASSYTASQFEKQEEEGIVFLPCAGWRDGGVIWDRDIFGYYWSSTVVSVGYGPESYFVYFNSSSVDMKTTCFYGHSVRLVTYVD